MIVFQIHIVERVKCGVSEISAGRCEAQAVGMC